jgi:hypothetical protein
MIPRNRMMPDTDLYCTVPNQPSWSTQRLRWLLGPDESGDPATRLTRRPTLVPLLETNSPSPPTSQYPGTAPMYLGNPGNLDFNDEK